jgi:hypothetical protein
VVEIRSKGRRRGEVGGWGWGSILFQDSLNNLRHTKLLESGRQFPLPAPATEGIKFLFGNFKELKCGRKEKGMRGRKGRCKGVGGYEVQKWESDLQSICC